jgi:CubicO group peptidase (beta-lactamase class C family)
MQLRRKRCVLNFNENKVKKVQRAIEVEAAEGMGHRAIACCFAILVSTLGARAEAPVFPPADTLQKAIQPLVDSLSQKYDCAVGVAVHNSNTSIQWIAGTVDNGTTAATTGDQFVWGSVTKVSTGAAVMQLVGAKKINLDDPIQPLIDPILKYMTSAQTGYTFTCLKDLFGSQVSKVTVKHLLGMKSGIPDYDTVSMLYFFDKVTALISIV